MVTIVGQVPRSVSRRLQHLVRRTHDAGLRTRALIVLQRRGGPGHHADCHAVHYHPSAVLKVLHRFRTEGEAGLRDHREDNGYPKVDEALREMLGRLIRGTPDDYGWARPTWTQEVLARQLAHATRVRVSASTVAARTLVALGARWGMARPRVACPWAPAAQGRRVRAIERLLATLPPRGGGVLRRRGGHPPQPADWAGLDGAGRAEDGADARAERQALPGRALHPRTGEVVWVGNGRKNSHLFLHLLRRLVAAFPGARKLHVIRDNYGIHSSRLVQYAVTHEFHGRIVLHFLPPYSPQHNRIERLWRELHANVTRNHRCRTLPELLRRVAAFLRRVSPYPGTQVSLLRAPKRRAA